MPLGWILSMTRAVEWTNARPFSSPPSPVPISPFVQRRSSYGQLPTVSAFQSGQPSPFPGPLPNALFEQPRSAPELTRTVFEFLFAFHMRYRKLQAQHRCREDLVKRSCSFFNNRTTPAKLSIEFPLARDCIKMLRLSLNLLALLSFMRRVPVDLLGADEAKGARAPRKPRSRLRVLPRNAEMAPTASAERRGTCSHQWRGGAK